MKIVIVTGMQTAMILTPRPRAIKRQPCSLRKCLYVSCNDKSVLNISFLESRMKWSSKMEWFVCLTDCLSCLCTLYHVRQASNVSVWLFHACTDIQLTAWPQSIRQLAQQLPDDVERVGQRGPRQARHSALHGCPRDVPKGVRLVRGARQDLLLQRRGSESLVSLSAHQEHKHTQQCIHSYVLIFTVVTMKSFTITAVMYLGTDRILEWRNTRHDTTPHHATQRRIWVFMRIII